MELLLRKMMPVAAHGIKPHYARAEPAGDAYSPTTRPGRQRDVRRDAAEDDDAALQQEDRGCGARGRPRNSGAP